MAADPSPFRVPDGERVYAIGDIHGRNDLLQNLLDKIRDDTLSDPGIQSQVVFLGDYIDRGADTAGVLRTLLAFAEETPSVFLKGNHETLLLDFLADPLAAFPAWANAGGLQTLTSYGLTPPLRPSPADAEDQRNALLEALPPDHLAFLNGLRPFHILGDYFFVHAGVRPRKPLAAQVETDLFWIREEFLEHAHLFEKRIVHGHTPVKEPELLPNRINVDTGAFVTGRLTAVALQDADARFIQAGPDH